MKKNSLPVAAASVPPSHKPGGLRAALETTGGRDAAATTTKLAILLFASIATTALPLTPVAAQPPEHSTVAEANIAAKVPGEWSALHKANVALQVTDPEKAIAAYKEFYEKRGRANIGISVEISSLIARIYWHQLNNRTKAGEIYQWAIREYGDDRAGARLKKEWAQLQAQSSAESVHKIDAAGLVNKTAAPGAPPVVPKTGADTPTKPPAAALPSKITSFAPENKSAAETVANPQVPSAPFALPGLKLPSSIEPFATATKNSSIPAPISGAKLSASPTSTAPEVEAVSSASLLATALIAQLQNGEITPAAAWAMGVLTPRDLLSALAIYKPDEKEKRRPLIALLAQHDFQNLETMKGTIQIEIGEYLRDTRDPRAVPLFERLAAKAEQPGPKASMLYRLAQSHEALGELEKAGDVLVQAAQALEADKKLLSWSSSSWIEAARMYTRAGDEVKAKAAYDKAQVSGYGWSAGLVTIDQAREMMTQGRHEEARRLLAMPLTGPQAEQIEPVRKMLIGDSHFATGDLESARRYLRNAVDQYKAEPNPVKGDGMGNIFASAQERLEIVERWIKEPIQVERQELQIVLDEKQPLDRPVIRRLRVQTYRDVPLAVAVNATGTGVQARLVVGDGWGYEQSDRDKELIVEIAPEAIKDGLSFTLVVSSPQFEKFRAKVLVKLQMSQ